MQQIENTSNIQNSVFLLSKCNNQDFEKAYIKARRKEQRVLDDDQVFQLPNAVVSNPHYIEWKIREQSAKHILSYLQKRKLNDADWILDIGCGNGWFSHLLAKTEGAKVLAIDINMIELKQAARVFKRDNLYFAYMDLYIDPLDEGFYSQIIFNSSFQYFENPKQIINLCLSLLKKDGEIHIVDSPFYETEKIPSAKLRSFEYYQNIDSLEMNQFYHHHSSSLFDGYNVEVLYQPAKNKIDREKNHSPFPWFKIHK